MTPAKTTTPSIRDRTGEWIGDGVEDQREGNGKPREIRGQTEHLAVVKKQERPKDTGLDAFGDLTYAEREFFCAA